jgi:GNAT superfamily N-acetyltransferase
MNLSGRVVSEIVEATTANEIEQVRSLFRQYQAELPLQLCFRSFDAELSGLPGAYGPPRGKLFLATVSGQPVGCVGLRPFPLEGACEMKRLYVRPTFRTRKLGRELAERVLQEARALGYRRLRLDTHPPTMQAAVNIYRSLGFRDIAVEDGVEGLLYMEVPL